MNVKRSLRTVAVAVVLLGSIVGAKVWMGKASAATQATPSKCANIQLLIRPGTSQGAAGHIFLQFRVHDLFGACTLYGYPGVELLNKNFQSMPTYVTDAPFPQGGARPKRVTISQGHDAYFVVNWSHIPAGTQSCPTARNVMIWAPNDNLPVVSYATIDACGGNLNASPIASKKFF